MKLNVLYEDNHLIGVYKPAGILVQGDKSGDISMMDVVKKYLKEKYKKPGNVFLGLIHRLDKEVQGVVLFSKTSKGASRLSEQFRNHKIEKIYHCIVLGKPKSDKNKLVDFLKKNKEDKAKKAELDYEVIASNKKYSLLKINLKTGRFHQIRIQLFSAGFPILGDIKYGASILLQGSGIALCATSISFKTATTDESKTISIPVPIEWKKYVDF